jgi:hypothetical protein
MLISVTSQNFTNMNAIFKIWHAYIFVELGFEFNMLYCLNQTSRPFFSGYFGDGVSSPVLASNYDPLFSASQYLGSQEWATGAQQALCLFVYASI